MKILIINTYDRKGGAARSAYRLHKSLQEIGIDSCMLVQDKTGDDYSVLGPATNFEKTISKIRPQIDSIRVRFYRTRQKISFSEAWLPARNIIRKINEINPDIVHLHWVARGMLSIGDIAKIQKPIVWTLHDMWAFTGGCHYDNYCGKYKGECGACPVLNSAKEGDLSREIFRRKRKAYQKMKGIFLVGPSHWIVDCAAGSQLLGGRPIVNIPNPIDTQVFRPVGVKEAREILGLPLDKKLVLFGTCNFINFSKGYDKLLAVSDKIKNVEIVIFGMNKPKQSTCFKLPVHYFGRLADDLSLKILYSAADVTIFPSIQENLSNVIMESLSCGTPVVAFNVGGNRDMIEHQVNGYLAQPCDPEDLARGVNWVLACPEYGNLRQQAREKVLREFDKFKIAGLYKNLYENILKRGE